MEYKKVEESLEKVLNCDADLLLCQETNHRLMRECFNSLYSDDYQHHLSDDAGLDFKKFTILCECLFVNKQKVQYYVPMQWKIELFHTFDQNNDKLIDLKEFEWAWNNWILTILRPRSALIVVDVQNDFISGSLAISAGPAGHNGEDVVPVVNQLINDVSFDCIAFSIDWHPANHISFHDNLHLRKFQKPQKPQIRVDSVDCEDDNQIQDDSLKPNLYDTVIFEGPPQTQQKLWPSHCIQESWGAQLHAQLNVPSKSILIYKGINSNIDSYSAFWDNQKLSETDLNRQLKENRITDVYVCGIAYDVCVGATANDAQEYGYRTTLIDDASMGLSVNDIKNVQSLLRKKNALVIKSEKVKDMVSGRDRKPELGYALGVNLIKNKLKGAS